MFSSQSPSSPTLTRSVRILVSWAPAAGDASWYGRCIGLDSFSDFLSLALFLSFTLSSSLALAHALTRMAASVRYALTQKTTPACCRLSLFCALVFFCLWL